MKLKKHVKQKMKLNNMLNKKHMLNIIYIHEKQYKIDIFKTMSKPKVLFL